jgi:hypothetical protein
LRIDPDVLRNLGRIPKGDARRVLLAIKALPANPYCGDIQKMKGQENTGDAGLALTVSSTS